MGKGLEQTFLQRYANDHQAHEKMLNITNHQRNVNQNHEIPTHTYEDDYYQKQKKREKTENNKYWQGYGEIETLVHCWLERKMVQLLWKIVWWFLKKLKIELLHDPQQFQFWVYTLKN